MKNMAEIDSLSLSLSLSLSVSLDVLSKFTGEIHFFYSKITEKEGKNQPPLPALSILCRLLSKFHLNLIIPPHSHLYFYLKK
jgi:hypothetical protein